MRFIRLTKHELAALKAGDAVIVFQRPFKGFPDGFRSELLVHNTTKDQIQVGYAKYCRKSGFYTWFNAQNKQQWSPNVFLAKPKTETA